MDWEAIGAIGDFFGGLVVIVSVAYLAVQIRQSNRHAEASAELTWLHDLNEIWDRWAVESKTIAIRRPTSWHESCVRKGDASTGNLTHRRRRKRRP